MNDPHTTDWAAIGLPTARGINAFQSVPPKGVEKPFAAPKKRGAKSKAEQLMVSLETPEERAARIQSSRAIDMRGRRTVDLAPRSKGAISIHGFDDTAKSQRISRGRSI